MYYIDCNFKSDYYHDDFNLYYFTHVTKFECLITKYSKTFVYEDLIERTRLTI